MKGRVEKKGRVDRSKKIKKKEVGEERKGWEKQKLSLTKERKGGRRQKGLEGERERRRENLREGVIMKG